MKLERYVDFLDLSRAITPVQINAQSPISNPTCILLMVWILVVICSYFNLFFSVKQQAKMAAYCRSIFGDMLLVDPLDGFSVSISVLLSCLALTEVRHTRYFFSIGCDGSMGVSFCWIFTEFCDKTLTGDGAFHGISCEGVSAPAHPEFGKKSWIFCISSQSHGVPFSLQSRGSAN